VDAAGNLYFAQGTSETSQEQLLVEWNASTHNLTTLATNAGMEGIALDSSDNIYIVNQTSSDPRVVNQTSNGVERFSAADGSLTTLLSTGLYMPSGVAMDAARDIYISDSAHNTIKVLPSAYLDPAEKLESLAAGADSLPVIVPATQNLTGPYAPASDSSWLTITGVANGVVSFAFTANNGLSRTGHISLLGQTFSVTQGDPLTLASTQLLTDGAVQLSFSGAPRASYTVLSSTDLRVPLRDWTVLGNATNLSGNLYQLIATPPAGAPQSYYMIRSP
jgi:hypothetical protein